MGVRPGGRGGFALLGALWLMVFLSVVGLDFALRVRSQTARAMSIAERAAASAAAEGCIAWAGDVLAERLRQSGGGASGAAEVLDPWREPYRLLSDTVEIGGAWCTVRLEDAGARLHLNRASEAELRGLLRALGVDARKADALAQAILDWRDADDLRRAEGGERAEYVKEGLVALPANGPFGSVDELRRVMGVTPGIFARVAPHLLVEGSGRINLAAAAPEVIGSLPGVTPELLSAILDARRGGRPVGDLLALRAALSPSAQDRLQHDLPALLPRVVGETVEVLIVARVRLHGGAAGLEARAVAARASGSALVVERRLR